MAEHRCFLYCMIGWLVDLGAAVCTAYCLLALPSVQRIATESERCVWRTGNGDRATEW